jgi:rubrerythrin
MARSESPGYFAIIPATVRYDKSLSPNAKLLYGEITALCKKEGYCWASNSYFADLYGVDRSSISNWVKKLAAAGYVRIELVYATDKPNIQMRKIYPIMDAKQNATNAEDGGEAANIEGGGEISHQGGEKNHQGVVKNFNGGGEKTQEILLQANNKKAAAADQNKSENEKPPDKSAAAESFEKTEKQNKTHAKIPREDVENLRRHFKHIDPNLKFDSGFYPKVLEFLEMYNLGLDYVSWFYNLCRRNQKIKNVNGYLYKSFLESRYVEIYHEASRSPPVSLFVCPVCSLEHSKAEQKCPKCGIEKENSADEDKIFRFKRMLSMKDDERKAYDAECESIIRDGALEFREKSMWMKNLDIKYGLKPTGKLPQINK